MSARESLSSFVVDTPEGDILIDSTYEVNVPVIQDSMSKLGLKFSNIKIVVGSHAHGDHQEADAMVAEMTGAKGDGVGRRHSRSSANAHAQRQGAPDVSGAA